MKTKHRIAAVLMMVAITGLIQAQTFYPILKNYSVADKARLDKIYSAALSRSNDDLVVSVLGIVTMMKLDVPADEFRMISKKIDWLASHSDNPLVRYRACLAGSVFGNPARYSEEGISRYTDADALFNALAENTTKTVLSSN